jgi:hypothetical protein
MLIKNSIPLQLRRPAETALVWINKTQERSFELTGLVDYESALEEQNTGKNFELSLVLCDDDICACQKVKIQSVNESYKFTLVVGKIREIPPLLDPPEGVRSKWLSQVLDKHEFVILLFYRGLW